MRHAFFKIYFVIKLYRTVLVIMIFKSWRFVRNVVFTVSLVNCVCLSLSSLFSLSLSLHVRMHVRDMIDPLAPLAF